MKIILIIWCVLLVFCQQVIGRNTYYMASQSFGEFSDITKPKDSILRDTLHRKSISLGSRHAGLGIGSLDYYNGIKFSAKESDSIINGLNFNFWGSKGKYPYKAKVNGVQIALGTEVKSINGLNINALYTEAENINGILINGGISYIGAFNGLNVSGILNSSDGSKGVSLSGIVQVNDNFKGIAISPFNITTNSVGLLIGGINSASEYKGVLIGVINACDNDYGSTNNRNGILIGSINLTNNYNALQIALLNLVYPGSLVLMEESKGVQLGLLNYSGSFTGLQIGLLNINRAKKRFKVLPFVNYRSSK